MSKQFPDVNCQYGAPMGRREYHDKPTKGIRLFLVCLDRGGYDDGGAYWGSVDIRNGVLPLYCATDNADYREFVRTTSRDAAAQALGLSPQMLKRPTNVQRSQHELATAFARTLESKP